PAPGTGVEEGLLADPVAGQEEGVVLFVPEGEGEHAAQMLDTAGAVLLVGVDDRLGVALAVKAVAEALQAGSQLREVVDFSVERYPDGAVLVGHRLAAAYQVDDAEATLPQGGRTVDGEAFPVRPAVDQPLAHALQLG